MLLRDPVAKVSKEGIPTFWAPTVLLSINSRWNSWENSRTGHERLQEVGIRVGKSYWVNSEDSGLLATAIAESDPLYFTVKKKNPFLPVISRIEKKMIIRESNAVLSGRRFMKKCSSRSTLQVVSGHETETFQNSSTTTSPNHPFNKPSFHGRKNFESMELMWRYMSYIQTSSVEFLRG